jgi:hypothetical protein
VHVRIAFGEEELRRRVKEKWRAESKAWELPLRVVKELGLIERGRGGAGFLDMGTREVPRCTNPVVPISGNVCPYLGTCTDIWEHGCA